MRQTRSRRLRRRTSRQGRKGGAKLGEGQYGIAFRPPLPCEGDEHSDKINEGFVGKVLPASKAQKELDNGLIIKALDPEGLWSAPCSVLCKPAARSPNINAFVAARKGHPGYNEEMKQIIAPFAGKSLFHLLVQDGAAFNESMFNQEARFGDLLPAQLDTFIQLIKDFLPVLKKLNKTWLHGDIHPGNIAWDGSRLRMIDFGEMKSVESVVEFRKENWTMTLDEASEDLREMIIDEVLKDLILDEARCMDMNALFSGVLAVIGSRWVNTTFPGRFNDWLANVEENQPKFYNDFVVALMTLP